MPMAVQADTVDTLNAGKGAYVLIIQLKRATDVSLPKRQNLSLIPGTLTPGTYLYVGSANGPGGIRARLKRHFRRDKKIHWHVDQLTTRAHHMEAIAVADGNECSLGQALLASGQFQVALPGFGSSDCRTCDSHLLTPC